MNPETAKAASWTTGQAPPPSKAPAWANHSRGPGVSSSAGYPNQSVPVHMPPAVAAFQNIAQQGRTFHTDLARERRQGAARDLATTLQGLGANTGVDRPTRTEEGRCCAICMETYNRAESVSMLHCKHHFHVGCIDAWCALRLGAEDRENLPPDCPMCRQEVVVQNVVEALGLDNQIAEDAVEFADSRQSDSNASSTASLRHGNNFPIFPAAIGTSSEPQMSLQRASSSLRTR